MRDLISFSYNVDASNLEAFGDIFFMDHGDRYTYIIPVGEEKNTTFFHLLKFINESTNFNHVFTREGAATLLIRDKHFYCMESKILIHRTIGNDQLDVPVLYPAEYPLAQHFKVKWIDKTKINEEYLNLAIDKTPKHLKSVLFDLATFYNHLTEEAYRLVADFEDTTFSTSLCHARVKPETPLYEMFMPEYLVLDNRSRVYCEYLRYLFLESNNMEKIEHIVARITSRYELREKEWQFLYARLFFPTHFYDLVYDIIIHGEINLQELFDQTSRYSDLLLKLPFFVQKYGNILLDCPEWVKNESIY